MHGTDTARRAPAFYEVVRPGFKYNMTDIQAAIGLHQLREQPRFSARRAKSPGATTPRFHPWRSCRSPRSVRTCATRGTCTSCGCTSTGSISRNQFIEELAKCGIRSSVHFIPIHLHPLFRDKYAYQPEDFPVANREFPRVTSLPLYPGMTDQDVADVIDAVTSIARRHACPID